MQLPSGERRSSVAADNHPKTSVCKSLIFQFLQIVVEWQLQLCVSFADFMSSPVFHEQKRTMCILICIKILWLLHVMHNRIFIMSVYVINWHPVNSLPCPSCSTNQGWLKVSDKLDYVEALPLQPKANIHRFIYLWSIYHNAVKIWDLKKEAKPVIH